MEEKNNKPMDFWNDHSLEFLEMAFKRDYQERVEVCDGFGEKIRECGDKIVFYLVIRDGIITTVSYDIEGCLFSHACANTLIKLVLNQNVKTARQIRPEDIIGYLKTLPKAEAHCARHAIAAFSAALDDYEKKSG